MSIREYLITLRIKINNNPEFKMKLMWALDKIPILKNLLKKIGEVREEKGISSYEALSPYAKEIYNKITKKAN